MNDWLITLEDDPHVDDCQTAVKKRTKPKERKSFERYESGLRMKYCIVCDVMFLGNQYGNRCADCLPVQKSLFD